MDLFGNDDKVIQSLADKYLLAPTSVLSTRELKWQQLKRKWHNLGIKSELGRNTISDNVTKGLDINDYAYLGDNFKFKSVGLSHSVSIFDPVLCEIIYKWFSPVSGTILDPFAGGSVRGIVANKLGYKYTGIELSQLQVDSNREQSLSILDINNQPQWYVGDSDEVLNIPFNHQFDLIFSCPPYMNLEVYSDDIKDLSNMSDIDFNLKYESIIHKSCNQLKSGCYAVFVVSDIRDNKGNYKGFVKNTIQYFQNAGMNYYNELILVTPVGTKAMTMERGFKYGKLARVHQNILIFKK